VTAKTAKEVAIRTVTVDIAILQETVNRMKATCIRDALFLKCIRLNGFGKRASTTSAPRWKAKYAGVCHGARTRSWTADSSEWWGLQEPGPLLDQDDQGAQVE
jgi:hypothetical protein